MKTLDEVIELCEKALWCAYLPQDDTTTTAGLALHYLREYREMKEHLACLDAVALHGEDTQRVNNPALTWDELREMEGKPVWVEEIEDDKILFGQWDIISGFGYSENFDLIDYENPIINFYISGNRTKFGLGKTWQAYKKEKE